jgi:hypothetical protein
VRGSPSRTPPSPAPSPPRPASRCHPTLSAELKAHLAEPFFKTREPGRRAGLRLAAVYGIARQSGGCLAVESVNDPWVGRPAEFLAKPFTAGSLLARVRAVLDGPRGSAGAEPDRPQAE